MAKLRTQFQVLCFECNSASATALCLCSLFELELIQNAHAVLSCSQELLSEVGLYRMSTWDEADTKRTLSMAAGACVLRLMSSWHSG